MLPDRGKPVVLIVDDTLDSITLVHEILKNKYRVIAATDGAKALVIARRAQPDIILLDVMMPVADGYETCRRLKKDKKLKDIPILFLTAKSRAEDEEKGLDLGAVDYIVKPVSPPILLARIKTHLTLKRSRDFLRDKNSFLEAEIERRTKDISTVQEASIMAIGALAEMRDDDTGRHLQRAKLYIKELAEYLGQRGKFARILTPEKINNIVISSPLHDIGKIGIPDEILLKPGPLTAEEYEVMKGHTLLGRAALLRAERLMGDTDNFLTCAREIAYSHHEKWDGSGYPQGLAGEEIPLAARLMAVVDAYDALTSERVYKEAVSHERAVNTIKADSGSHFDPDVVEAFLVLKERFREISLREMDSETLKRNA